jgi:hypothetical protein
VSDLWFLISGVCGVACLLPVEFLGVFGEKFEPWFWNGMAGGWSSLNAGMFFPEAEFLTESKRLGCSFLRVFLMRVMSEMFSNVLY